MNVVQRNFIRLLMAGTFSESGEVEAMSPHKWRQLFQLSALHGVSALVFDGIEKHRDDFHLRLPDDLREQWRQTVAEIERENTERNTCLAQMFAALSGRKLRPILLNGYNLSVLYPNPHHRTVNSIDVYFPYEEQSRAAAEWLSDNSPSHETKGKGVTAYTLQGFSAEHSSLQGFTVEHRSYMQHLTNPFLNRRLQKIINREIRCCDSYYLKVNGSRIEGVPPTLSLLLLITQTTRSILSYGVKLRQFVDLGMFLRRMGDKVDYVLLQSQLRRLGMQRMANLIGAIMMDVFRFDSDELPFMTAPATEKKGKVAVSEVLAVSHENTDDWYFTQGNHIFVRSNNSSAMLWHIRHSMKFMRYYPAETFTNFFVALAHSLSHIEE